VALALSGAGALIAAQLPMLLDGAVESGDSVAFVHCGGVSDFQHLTVCDRPIAPAGFYWLTAADPQRSIILQHTISIVTWVGAGLLACTLFRPWRARLVAFAGVIFVKIGFGLFTFDSFLIGDSIAASLAAVATVSAFVTVVWGGMGALIVASICIPLCIFARDTQVWTLPARTVRCAALCAIGGTRENARKFQSRCGRARLSGALSVRRTSARPNGRSLARPARRRHCRSRNL